MTDLDWTLAVECADGHDRVVVWEQVFHGAREDLTAQRLMPPLWLAGVAFSPGPCTAQLANGSTCGLDPAIRMARMLKLAQATVDQMSDEHRRVAWQLRNLER